MNYWGEALTDKARDLLGREPLFPTFSIQLFYLMSLSSFWGISYVEAPWAENNTGRITPQTQTAVGKTYMGLMVSVLTMEKWSSKFGWQERVKSFGIEVAAERENKLFEQHTLLGSAMAIKAIKQIETLIEKEASQRLRKGSE